MNLRYTDPGGNIHTEYVFFADNSLPEVGYNFTIGEQLYTIVSITGDIMDAQPLLRAQSPALTEEELWNVHQSTMLGMNHGINTQVGGMLYYNHQANTLRIQGFVIYDNIFQILSTFHDIAIDTSSCFLNLTEQMPRHNPYNRDLNTWSQLQQERLAARRAAAQRNEPVAEAPATTTEPNTADGSDVHYLVSAPIQWTSASVNARIDAVVHDSPTGQYNGYYYTGAADPVNPGRIEVRESSIQGPQQGPLELYRVRTVPQHYTVWDGEGVIYERPSHPDSLDDVTITATGNTHTSEVSFYEQTLRAYAEHMGIFMGTPEFKTDTEKRIQSGTEDFCLF